MRYGPQPTYDLQTAKALVAKGDYRVTEVAFAGASSLYLDEQDIIGCVLGLDASDFYKTMPSSQRPGDVPGRLQAEVPWLSDLPEASGGRRSFYGHHFLQEGRIRMNETCFACGGEAVHVEEPREVQIGHRSVTVEVAFMRCTSCLEVYFLPGQMEALQRSAADRVREEEGLLSPAEILQFRSQLGVSQADFERLLGVGPKTAGRWERGTVFQGAAADTLMRVLRRYPAAVVDLARERGIELAPAFGVEEGPTLEKIGGRPMDLSFGGAELIPVRTGRTGATIVQRANDHFAMSA